MYASDSESDEEEHKELVKVATIQPPPTSAAARKHEIESASRDTTEITTKKARIDTIIKVSKASSKKLTKKKMLFKPPQLTHGSNVVSEEHFQKKKK